MPDLRLTDDDARALREVLSSYLSDLRMEIADTEDFSLRERLKATESLLKRLIGQLGSATS
ncbi:MAG TPA: hypothetical protein VKD22_17630 [Ramlibacter sp.]|jgi:hypothetical protein|nr:hypothetical protein [Ramlibacter sp.]